MTVQEHKFRLNLERLYMVVWQQSSECLRTKLAAMDGFNEVEEALDGLQLLRLVLITMQEYQDKQCAGVSILKARLRR